jgi:hypothetical protein
MNRRLTLAILAAVASSTALVAYAQSAKTVAGAYSPVTVPAYGDKPKGQMILTPDLAKIAAGSRTQGTPEENKTVVHGSIAHTGRYTIDDGGKSITFRIDTSTFPNWNGTTQKRALKVSGDTLIYTVTTPSAGGAPNDVTWKRVK